MGILTGSEIKKKIELGDIIISPYDEKQINPNSYNVRLHPELKVYENKVLDIEKENPYRTIEISNEGLVLEPGILYIGRTIEYTTTKPEARCVPCIDGRSSTARLGISCHISAGFGDIGFKGTFTCEISVIQPVRIIPNLQIGQIYYLSVEGNTDIVYNGKYQGQIDATTSRFFFDANK